MNKRLEMLEKLTTSGKADSFGWYALAMEYRIAKRNDDALATFAKLCQLDPDYVPMYLMAGQMLAETARAPEARTWFEQGMQKARARGDMKALGELEQALEEVR